MIPVGIFGPVYTHVQTHTCKHTYKHADTWKEENNFKKTKLISEIEYQSYNIKEQDLFYKKIDSRYKNFSLAQHFLFLEKEINDVLFCGIFKNNTWNLQRNIKKYSAALRKNRGLKMILWASLALLLLPLAWNLYSVLPTQKIAKLHELAQTENWALTSLFPCYEFW